VEATPERLDALQTFRNDLRELLHGRKPEESVGDLTPGDH